MTDRVETIRRLRLLVKSQNAKAAQMVQEAELLTKRAAERRDAAMDLEMELDRIEKRGVQSDPKQ